MFRADLKVDQMGINVHSVGTEIRVAVPILVVVGKKPLGYPTILRFHTKGDNHEINETRNSSGYRQYGVSVVRASKSSDSL